MKAAAVHFETLFADVFQNFTNAERLVCEAAENQADLVILARRMYDESQKIIYAQIDTSERKYRPN